MSAPDPEGVSMLTKVLGAAAVIFGPIGGLWLYVDNRFAKKSGVDSALQDVKHELGIQREHIGTLFDKLAQSEERNEERHRELLMHLLKKGD